MAGFQYSYRQCTSRNLQNLYSGNERAPVMYLKEKKIERFLNRRKLLMDLLPSKPKKETVEETLENRLKYYDKDLGIKMPRAPAFREADSETIYEIVQRLHRPESATVYHKTQPPSELLSSRMNSSRTSRCLSARSMSEKEVDLVFARLHATHTHCSRIKSARGRQETVFLKDGVYVIGNLEADKEDRRRRRIDRLLESVGAK